jgi:hypothetical protein
MYHKPIGGLLHDTAGGAADAALALDECQLEHYRKHGYVAGVRVLDDYQVSTPLALSSMVCCRAARGRCNEYSAGLMV